MNMDTATLPRRVESVDDWIIMSVSKKDADAIATREALNEINAICAILEKRRG
jgi:hypothetical protein